MTKYPGTSVGVAAILALSAACGPAALAPSTATPSISAPATASAPAFTTIDVPGATFANAYDITDAGEIVGRFVSASDKQTHGFRRGADGTFTTIDFPGAVFTVATGVAPNGDIVGQYRLATDAAPVRHGFLKSGTAFTTIDGPGASFTNALGVDGHGSVTGRYCGSSTCAIGRGGFHGFLRTGTGLNPIDVPDAVETHAWKINSQGQVVGAYKAADGKFHLYLWTAGIFTMVVLPGAVVDDVAAENGGVSPRGDVVGSYCSVDPCKADNGSQHGFRRSPDGAFTIVDFPGAVNTFVFGINARCDMVGLYTDAGGVTHAFLAQSQAPTNPATPCAK